MISSQDFSATKKKKKNPKRWPNFKGKSVRRKPILLMDEMNVAYHHHSWAFFVVRIKPKNCCLAIGFISIECQHAVFFVSGGPIGITFHIKYPYSELKAKE